MAEPTETYRAARDQLLGLRGQQAEACATFRWPDLGDRFNRAVDWFDAVARGSDRPALVVDADGSAQTRTYDELASRSDQVAAWLSRRGVRRGDPVTYIGRTDEVFRASDYKISPFELESVLIEHPAVGEAAIVPDLDPIRLAVPKANVALVAGYEPTEVTALDILRYARERLAPCQRVRRIEFAELPKTISGKIRRVELRGRETALADSGEPATGEFRDEKLRGQSA